MKRLSADDSADSRVKVGHRQAPYTPHLNPLVLIVLGGFGFLGFSLLLWRVYQHGCVIKTT